MRLHAEPVLIRFSGQIEPFPAPQVALTGLDEPAGLTLNRRDVDAGRPAPARGSGGEIGP